MHFRVKQLTSPISRLLTCLKLISPTINFELVELHARQTKQIKINLKLCFHLQSNQTKQNKNNSRTWISLNDDRRPSTAHWTCLSVTMELHMPPSFVRLPGTCKQIAVTTLYLFIQKYCLHRKLSKSRCMQIGTRRVTTRTPQSSRAAMAVVERFQCKSYATIQFDEAVLFKFQRKWKKKFQFNLNKTKTKQKIKKENIFNSNNYHLPAVTRIWMHQRVVFKWNQMQL